MAPLTVLGAWCWRRGRGINMTGLHFNILPIGGLSSCMISCRVPHASEMDKNKYILCMND